LLADPNVSVEQRQHWLGIINRQAEQLSKLVDDLLDVSRIDSGRVALDPRPVDLPALLQPVLETLALAAPQHTVVADLATGPASVLADADKLRQILTNLLGNAIKYSPEGGRVSITARPAA